MKIKWLGHSSFLITSQTGTTIITDPYKPDDRLKHAPITESADIVTVSHGHGDHANVAAVGGKPLVVDKAGRHDPKGIAIRGVSTFHDDQQGAKRGPNVVFCMNVDGLNVCHLGDLGHPLSEGQAGEIGPVDVLIVPVGGFYTIDAAVADDVTELLHPRVVIPMHYRNPKCDFPVAEVGPFLEGKKNAKRLGASEVELTKETLPSSTEVFVLQPAK
jgi:L-ascorbate metabolism protein UlaG (beta-lactamase superfamily)